MSIPCEWPFCDKDLTGEKIPTCGFLEHRDIFRLDTWDK